MHILLTNDDGVFAPGIKVLARLLRDRGRLTVIAPRQEQSGIGHAITYRSPIGVERVRLDGCEEAFAVDGTPADCVKFALLELLPEPPELVLSGINLGFNLGHNIFYSGTVAAAIEGAMYGVRSVALSTSYRNEDRLRWAAAQGARALDLILDRGDESAALAYNVETAWGDKKAFNEMLRGLGYEIRSKELVVRADGSRKGDWDVGIAADIIERLDKLDVVVLGSGDGDFLPIVRKAKERGLTVEVYAFPNTAVALKEEADYYPIDESLLQKERSRFA